MRVIQVFKPSLTYAAIVFGVGFVLGALRIFLVVPRIGVRWAELLEMPLMLFASFVVARAVTKRWGPFGRAESLLIGITALAFMLLAEFSFISMRGFTIAEYLASKDPIAGAAYFLSLAIFAAMPWLVNIRQRPTTR